MRLATVLGVILVAAAVSLTAAKPVDENSMTPKIIWAQRSDLLFLKFVVSEPYKVELSVNDTHVAFHCLAPARGGISAQKDDQYHAVVGLYRKIEAQLSKYEELRSGVQLALPKKWEARYWPRLLKEPQSHLASMIGVDWSRYKAEENIDDDVSSRKRGDDEEDEDEVKAKAPELPEEMIDDSHLWLLRNETELTSFGELNNVSTVLFFTRKLGDRKSRGLYGVFSRLAAEYATGLLPVPVAAVDARSSPELRDAVKRLHIVSLPATKLLFSNGDIFDYDAADIGYLSRLREFLKLQLQPAITQLESYTEAAEFVQSGSAIVGFFLNDSLVSETQSDNEKAYLHVAKEWRAMPIPGPLKWGKLGFDENDIDAKQLRSDLNVAPDFLGAILVKKFHNPIPFRFPPKMKHKTLKMWAYKNQFLAIEHITRQNFEMFRKKGLPMVFVILDELRRPNEDLLEKVHDMAAAEKLRRKMTFVYLWIHEMDQSIKQYLRCEMPSPPKSYAVIDDIEEEYRYCIVPRSDESDRLTVEKIQASVEKFLSKEAVPDHVMSESAPPLEKQYHALKTIVADTVKKTAFDPRRDVLIHLYSEIDDEWEWQEHVLVQLAEEMEDKAPNLLVGKMDGVRNERPPDFVEPGYFPCTIMFPAVHNTGMQASPIRFNSSRGFDVDLLVEFVNETATYKLPPLKIPEKKLKERQEKLTRFGRLIHIEL